MNLLVFVFIFTFGACIGSFLNAIIYRLKNRGRIFLDRSKCPKCKHKLKAWHLIPIFSFLFLKAKCGFCHKKISWQYFFIELVCAVAFCFLFYLSFPAAISGFTLIGIIELIRNLVFFCFLLIIFVYDLKYFLILDKVVFPAIIISLFFNVLLIILNTGNIFPAVYLLIAGLLGLIFFLFQFIISKGKWIGGGDIRFGLMMGLMLGWPMIVTGLLLTYFIGGIFASILLILKKKKFGSKLPMGTFLAIGTLITLLFGQQIVDFYFNYVL